MSVDAKPGDLTICRYPGGYLVGRLRETERDSVVLEQETTVARLCSALRYACGCAEREGIAVWIEVDGCFERADLQRTPLAI